MSILGAARKVLRNPTAIRNYLHLIGISIDPEGTRISKWGFGKLKREYITEIFPEITKVDIEIIGPFRRQLDMSLDTLEICFLCSLAKYIDAKNILEIGTYDGNTALNLASNTADDAKIFTVDLPLDWDGNFFAQVPDKVDNSSEPSLRGAQFVGGPYASKIELVLCDSAILDYGEFGTKFDLFFIDGCHVYEYVKIDTENAIKHTRKGGLIVWHDYGYIDPVSAVVDEYADQLQVRSIRGTRLAVGINVGG